MLVYVRCHTIKLVRVLPTVLVAAWLAESSAYTVVYTAHLYLTWLCGLVLVPSIQCAKIDGSLEILANTTGRLMDQKHSCAKYKYCAVTTKTLVKGPRLWKDDPRKLLYAVEQGDDKSSPYIGYHSCHVTVNFVKCDDVLCSCPCIFFGYTATKLQRILFFEGMKMTKCKGGQSDAKNRLLSGSVDCINPQHYFVPEIPKQKSGSATNCVVYGCHNTPAFPRLSFFKMPDKSNDNETYGLEYAAVARADLKGEFGKPHFICSSNFNGADLTAWYSVSVNDSGTYRV